MNIINRIHSLFIKPQFIYGQIIQSGIVRDGKYRLNTVTGDVEFVLWKAGQQNYKDDYWHRMDSSWHSLFVPFKRGE